MTRFEDMINERANSEKWSSDIAHRVLNKKAILIRKTRLLLSAAASIAVIVGAGFFYQMNQKTALKNTFEYVVSETVSVPNENTIISKEMDNNIIQYCMNIE